MQFEIDRTLNHHNGGLYGDGRNWIAWPAPEYEQVIRPTDWNELLVKVEGNHMVAVLNGVEVLNFTDPTPKSFDGYIALQLHSGGDWATCGSRTSTCVICRPRPRQRVRTESEPE